MKNTFKIALIALVSIVAGNSYALEKFTVDDLHKEVQQSEQAAKQKAEKEAQEEKERKERQQNTFDQATQDFYKTGSLR